MRIYISLYWLCFWSFLLLNLLLEPWLTEDSVLPSCGKWYTLLAHLFLMQWQQLQITYRIHISSSTLCDQWLTQTHIYINNKCLWERTFSNSMFLCLKSLHVEHPVEVKWCELVPRFFVEFVLGLNPVKDRWDIKT